MTKYFSVVLLLVAVGCILAEYPCGKIGFCALKDRSPLGCARCCDSYDNCWDAKETGMWGRRDDRPDWATSVECSPDEHCCRKSAMGGGECAKCCPNNIEPSP